MGADGVRPTVQNRNGNAAMKYFHLVWSALMRRKTRTIFTMISIIVAFLLFGMLDAVRVGFANAGQTAQGARTLMTLPKLGGLSGQLPISLEQQIARVRGVTTVSKVTWFGGVYQDPKNFFPSEAVSGNIFDGDSDVEIPPDQLKAFQTTRDGAVVGAALARKFHWKIGDRIPLKAVIWPQKDGSDAWSFQLVGLFHATDPSKKGDEQVMFIRWDY
ncbi:MAG TPA: ABC transporter permease, partial [Rhodanobacteraceae bacterium]